LYSKGRVLGHKRAKRNTRPNTSLIQIEGVATKEDAQFYLGKVRNYPKDMNDCFSYGQLSVLPTFIKRKKKFKAQKSGSSGGVFQYIPCHTIAHLLPINRRVTRPHGSSGVVKSKFRSNLPPRAFGASVRVVRLKSMIRTQLFLTCFADALPLERLNCFFQGFIPLRIVCCNMACSVCRLGI
jgi:large subunit ribosomal protein L35Ae